MRKIMQFLINIVFCHLLYRVKYKNLEIVNKFNKCILCPNHSNIFDPVWIYAKVDKMSMMAKSELFENKFIGGALRFFGAFPIRRGKKDAKSLLHAIHILQDNEKARLLIFPEGGILKIEDRRHKITDGPSYIASKTEVPIIPVYITENPKLFSKIKITFGNPLYITKEERKNKEKLTERSQELLKAIYEME